MSIEFLLTSLIVVLAPGTGVIYTLASGLGLGLRGSVFAAVGCTLGVLPQFVATLLGLAAIVHASALAFMVLKYAGAAYLLYLAWCAWRESGALSVGGAQQDRRMWRVLRRGITLNLLNPKLSIFFLAFLPQFIDPAAAPVPQMIPLGAVFIAMTLVVFLIYGALASLARTYVIEQPTVMKVLRRSFALAFAGLGVRLAFAGR
ncbi:MAG: LysE family transporter [Rhodovibrionaceae bacterium]